MSEQPAKIRTISDFDCRAIEKQNELNRAKKEFDLAYERKERAIRKAWEDFRPYDMAFRAARREWIADEEREEFRRTCLLDGRPLDSPVPMVSG